MQKQLIDYVPVFSDELKYYGTNLNVIKIQDLKEKNKYFDNNVFKFKYLTTLNKGKHFGELGIIDD